MHYSLGSSKTRTSLNHSATEADIVLCAIELGNSGDKGIGFATTGSLTISFLVV